MGMPTNDGDSLQKPCCVFCPFVCQISRFLRVTKSIAFR